VVAWKYGRNIHGHLLLPSLGSAIIDEGLFGGDPHRECSFRLGMPVFLSHTMSKGELLRGLPHLNGVTGVLIADSRDHEEHVSQHWILIRANKGDRQHSRGPRILWPLHLSLRLFQSRSYFLSSLRNLSVPGLFMWIVSPEYQYCCHTRCPRVSCYAIFIISMHGSLVSS
jgi:hypothetical protein